MPSVVVIGSQWGDEGKGKIVDYLAQKADAVVRYSGGSNAGHTVVVDNVAYKLRLLPSGILYHGKTCFLGNGVVINPGVVLKEIHDIKAQGVDISRILISDRAHVVLPYHARLDELQEAALGSAKIGTTKGGIGPCYMDKAARTGIRMCDLMDAETFAQKLRIQIDAKNELFTKIYGVEPLTYEEVLQEYLAYAEELRPYVTDTGAALAEVFQSGKSVLFEGAQATFLDIDHGTYPYVTSSNPTAGNAATGSGIGPRDIDHVVGVVKAYTTRVGEGPFVTELQDIDGPGHHLRETGHEYGTVTGRARRCGWLDAVMVKTAASLNSIDYLAITRLDILDNLPKIKMCVGYKYKGEEIKHIPASLKVLAEVEPIYEEFEGWMSDITGTRSYAELPLNARKYLERLKSVTGVEIGIVSVGAARQQTIVLKELL
ncbi:MAG TPA: adenylosuccinate synthase [Candidatus Avacidaminococcus intestinavium]|uniref:Adenylosuccinate synthetase n=1 Tax=Candidatus Avacidaminococcus intestinavium TaxID=2840684 RepID=A0A9D1MRP2_9FIRM|nr:adenylosuccinate synthase [Candidatus Avacidaminococcus intestinavium]